jgi:ATP-dependent Clp protease ATP-binding subunit ClpA
MNAEALSAVSPHSGTHRQPPHHSHPPRLLPIHTNPQSQLRPQDQKINDAGGDANFEALAKYGTDLTANAARLDPVIGRDDEIRRVVRILSR